MPSKPSFFSNFEKLTRNFDMMRAYSPIRTKISLILNPSLRQSYDPMD